MSNTWKEALWPQFGAAIDMIENALRACPDELWSDRARRPQFWYLVYHTLFYLDLYLSDSVEAFTPASFDTFGKAELLPEEEAPPFERPYRKDELQSYLEHGRKKCRATIEALTDETASQRSGFESSVAELLLYNMRHVQHHAAQLSLLLRQTTDSAPRWVSRTQSDPSE